MTHITYDIEELKANPQRLRMATNDEDNKTSGKNPAKRRGGSERARIGENHRIWNKLELELRGKQEKEFSRTDLRKKRALRKTEDDVQQEYNLITKKKILKKIRKTWKT